MFVYSMLFTDAEITANTNNPVKYYYHFNYAQDHASYPLTDAISNRLLILPGVDSVVTFLSIGSDQKTIYYWLVEHNKNYSNIFYKSLQYYFYDIQNRK